MIMLYLGYQKKMKHRQALHVTGDLAILASFAGIRGLEALG